MGAVGGWIRDPGSATRGWLPALLDAHGAATLPACVRCAVEKLDEGTRTQ